MSSPILTGPNMSQTTWSPHIHSTFDGHGSIRVTLMTRSRGTRLMMSSRRCVSWFLAAVVAISSQAAPRAETVLQRPTELVTDRAGVLSATEIETLTNDLQELEQSGLAQAIIYIDSSLPPG